jgi:outer membrane murein-binding lipoprotein Lpp
MSTISALKVFSFLGSKFVALGSSTRVCESYEMPGGTPKNKSEPTPWEQVLERLEKMDQNNTRGFETLNNKVSKLSTDFATMQSSQATLKQDVDEVKAETVQLKEDMVAVNDRADDAHKKIDDVHSKIDELRISTENRFRELESALFAKARALPVQFPTLSAGQQLSINERFESLRVQAKSCRNIFVMGHVPDYDKPAPLKSVLTNFFLKCEVKLLPKAGKTKVWRFSVPMGREVETKRIAEANVFGIRDHGWWIQQDLPPKLREMHSNAYSFIKLAKDRFLRLRKTFFEADDGYLTVEKTPLVPVYLIPKKKDKWCDLATVLASEIGGMVETEWLESVVSSNIDVSSLIEKWSAVLGVEINYAGGELGAKDAHDEDAVEDEDLENRGEGDG